MIWIILPAYEEAESLPTLIPKIRATMQSLARPNRIVIVDDGSSDNTAAVLERLRSDGAPIEVVSHWINRGLGETERDAFEYVCQNAHDDDVVVRMDCDDTHEPEYIEKLIARIDEGFEVVSTSRFRSGGGQLGVSRYRAGISYGANLFMGLMFHIPGVRDYSCGFRAYRASSLKDAVRVFGNNFLQLRGLGFTSTLETLVKLHILGCRFSEVPFVLRYDRKVSTSKMVGSVTTLGYLLMAFLYHWPFGGWRRQYAGLSRAWRTKPAAAVTKYARKPIVIPPVSRAAL